MHITINIYGKWRLHFYYGCQTAINITTSSKYSLTILLEKTSFNRSHCIKDALVSPSIMRHIASCSFFFFFWYLMFLQQWWNILSTLSHHLLCRVKQPLTCYQEFCFGQCLRSTISNCLLTFLLAKQYPWTENYFNEFRMQKKWEFL